MSGWFRRRWKALSAGFAVGLAATFIVATRPPDTGATLPCPEHDRLQVATGADVSVGGYRRVLFDKWNAGNEPTEKDVDIVELSPIADVATSEILATLQGDDCPRYDVVVIDVARTPEFAAAGLLAEIGDVPAGVFVPAALATGEWNGSQYALPFAADVGLLFRRKGEPEPKNWTDLWAYAGPEGLVTQNDDYEGGTVHLLEVAGGALVRDGEFAVDDASRQAFAAWWNARRAGKVAQGAYREQESLSTFISGRGAYLRHWPYALFKLRAAGVDVEYSALPGRALGGSNLAIAAKSPLRDEARAFIDRMTDVGEQQQLFSCGGYPPVVEAAYATVARCTLPGEEGRVTLPLGEAELKRYLDTIHQALKGAERPKLAHYGQFSQTLRACVNAVLQKPYGDGKAFAGALAGKLSEVMQDAIDGKPGPDLPCL